MRTLVTQIGDRYCRQTARCCRRKILGGQTILVTRIPNAKKFTQNELLMHVECLAGIVEEAPVGTTPAVSGRAAYDAFRRRATEHAPALN